MKNTALLKTMQGLAMSLLISVAAHANTSVYVFPVGATSTPNLEQPPWTVSNLLIASNPYFSNNGVGLNTGDQVGPVSDLPTYASMVDNASSAMYRPASVTASLVLDLGGTFSLNGLRLWNYAESYSGVTYNHRGVKDFTLSFSTDGGITFSNAQNFTAAIGGTLSGNRSAAQAFSFGDISANYVKLDMTSNHDNPLAPEGFSSGFGAIRFTAAPAPTYASWATTNAGDQTANLDYDNDGVPNGVEYFMNAALGFTANPGLVGNTVTWPNGGNILSSEYGTKFVVQTSTDLVTWEDVTEGNLETNDGSLSYIVSGEGNQFVRLKVTPELNQEP